MPGFERLKNCLSNKEVAKNTQMLIAQMLENHPAF